MDICEKKKWTGSQLYLYSAPPGSPAITTTDCKCILLLQPHSEMTAYVGTFEKTASDPNVDLNYNPCRQRVQMTTFKAFETPYL